jgi:hypothetical protein
MTTTDAVARRIALAAVAELAKIPLQAIMDTSEFLRVPLRDGLRSKLRRRVTEVGKRYNTIPPAVFNRKMPSRR